MKANTRLNTSGLTSVGFAKRMKRLNTDYVYRQRKYNMLHEMPEGFSKAMTLCSHLFLQRPPETSTRLPETLNGLRDIVGFFDIDSKRAFELLQLGSTDVKISVEANHALCLCMVEVSFVELCSLQSKFHRVRRGFCSSGTTRSIGVIAALVVSTSLANLDRLFLLTAPALHTMSAQQALHIAAACKPTGNAEVSRFGCTPRTSEKLHTSDNTSNAARDPRFSRRIENVLPLVDERALGARRTVRYLVPVCGCGLAMLTSSLLRERYWSAVSFESAD
mmetsp:Transcript_19210/g.59206  ORF Transcript_19210/g.59206 Transcript_19210/m.59206 type:complete len:277 (+) Transcript_19210:395-1225(+)